MKDFYPKTLKLDCSSQKLTNDEQRFKKIASKGLWIFKPGNLN